MQGLTLPSIVVDMKCGHKFNSGQIYVAFSRVKRLQDLYIHKYNQDAIKVSQKISVEMDRLRCNPVSIPPTDHFPQLHDARHQL